MTKTTEIVPSVNMPSADLINFRFDQNDKKTDELGSKLDNLIHNFASKEELDDVKRRMDTWTKYGWSVFVTLLIIIGGLIAAYIERGSK